MWEARIRTEFGDVRLSYESEEQLEQLLKNLPRQVAAIAAASKSLLPKQPRAPKPGYEHIYRFTPQGLVELLHFPTVKTKLACLALFAYQPDMVDASTVERVTGIANVQGIVLSQTKNRKYFRKDGELCGLTPEGISLVQESVPQVEPAPEDTPSE